MNITYKERQELNTLSLQAFGTSSKWRRLLDSGFMETWTRDREAMVTGPDGKMDKRTFVDKKYIAKHLTVEEIRKFMTDEIEKRNAADLASAKFAADQALVSAEETTKAI